MIANSTEEEDFTKLKKAWYEYIESDVVKAFGENKPILLPTDEQKDAENLLWEKCKDEIKNLEEKNKLSEDNLFKDTIYALTFASNNVNSFYKKYNKTPNMIAVKTAIENATALLNMLLSNQQQQKSNSNSDASSAAKPPPPPKSNPDFTKLKELWAKYIKTDVIRSIISEIEFSKITFESNEEKKSYKLLVTELNAKNNEDSEVYKSKVYKNIHRAANAIKNFFVAYNRDDDNVVKDNFDKMKEAIKNTNTFLNQEMPSPLPPPPQLESTLLKVLYIVKDDNRYTVYDTNPTNNKYYKMQNNNGCWVVDDDEGEESVGGAITKKRERATKRHLNEKRSKSTKSRRY